MKAGTSLIAFPAHVLLVLEERLKEHQAEGILDPAIDVTELAVNILILGEAAHRSADRRSSSRS